MLRIFILFLAHITCIYFFSIANDVAETLHNLEKSFSMCINYFRAGAPKTYFAAFNSRVDA